MAAPSEQYDRYYFEHYGGKSYNRQEMVDFLSEVAGLIVEAIQPRTVLDAGCAQGLLVAALRERGVEAWGIDISEYAIEHVVEDARPFCARASVIEPLEREYDLVVCLEVLEHLPQADGESAIKNFATHSRSVLFSSTASDFSDLTHVNVRTMDYWAEQFARCGMLRDVDTDVSSLLPDGVRFRRSEEPLPRVVAGYERLLARSQPRINALHQVAAEQRSRLVEMETELTGLRHEQAPWALELEAARAEIAAMRATAGWRALSRLRSLAPESARRGRFLRAIARGLDRRNKAG